MCISMARAHREWAKKVGHSEDSLFVNLYSLSISQNLEAWEEAKREIDKIGEHPNKLPESAPPDPSPPKPRRDSTATINGR